jgi:serine/threonine-protein kinase
VPEAREGLMVTPNIRLVRPLGEGGMGAVWVADHLALRTQVVVKFIASGLEGSKEAHDRFSREAAAAAQVKSPHVVQTFDHGFSDDGVPYIVMELLEGKDLGAALDEQGKLPPDVVVEIIAQLSRALDRAHERGIVHRDIKPGNIFLCDQGSGEVFVKLLDFGIAKGVEMPKVDSTTKTGAMIGSPFYMSPEQILGSKGIDHRSDLWSVGVVAFEALTGVKPFDAETMGGLAIKIHSEPLPLPTSLDPTLSPAVDAWFQRACARNVDERFKSAKELAESLAKALGGEMPKSIEMPRVSTGSSKASPQLAAGAATDAGVVRPATPSSTRSRVLALVAIIVLGAPGAFFGSRALLHKTNADARTEVTAEPKGDKSLAGGQAPLPPVASPSHLETPPPTPPPVVTPSAHLAMPVVAKPGHVARPRPPVNASPSSPPALPSQPPPPATTAKPVASGHDIF